MNGACGHGHMLQRGGAREEGAARVGVVRGRGGGGTPQRSSDVDLGASWSFLVFLLNGQRPVMVASLLGLLQWRVMACKNSSLGTPRVRYDEHSRKSSLSYETKVKSNQ
jgi:hypothetical protein